MRPASSKERCGEPDDVPVTALDPIHEGGPDALDRIPARASAPLPGFDVRGKFGIAELANVDVRDGVHDVLDARPDERESRMHSMHAAGERPQHGERVGRALRLAEDCSIPERDLGVHAEHEARRIERRDGTRLAEAAAGDDLHARPDLRELIVVRLTNLEVEPELLQNRAPLRRAGGEDEA